MTEPFSQAVVAKKTLCRQFSWTFPANAIYGACNLLLLVVLNKLGSTAIAGKFSLVLAITAPIFMFANLRFNTILASDMQPSVRVSDYFKLRIILLAAAICITAGGLRMPSSTGLGVLLMTVALAKAAEAISDLCCGLQQRIERMDRIAISLVSNGLTMIGSFAIVYYVSRRLDYAAMGLLASRLAVLLLYDIPAAHQASKHAVFTRPRPATHPEVLASMGTILLTAAPLGVTAALLSLSSNIPRYIIADEFGDDMLGLFCSVAVVLQAGNLVFRAIEQPAIPRLAQLLNEKNADGFWMLLESLMAGFLLVGVAGCALSLWVGPTLLSWVFSPAFRPMGGVLALMTLAMVIAQIAGMIESSLIAARLTAVQMAMHSVTTLSCFLLGVLLIPRFELYGAVLAVTICRFPFVLGGVLLLRRKLAEEPSSQSSGKSKRKAA